MNDNPNTENIDPFTAQGMDRLVKRFEQHLFELRELVQALSVDSADKIELLERYHRLSKEGERMLEGFERATDIAPLKGVDPSSVSAARAFISQLRSRVVAANQLYSKLKAKWQ